MLREVDLRTGAVLRTVQAAANADTCITSPPAASASGGAVALPGFWLGRSDFAVRAFDEGGRGGGAGGGGSKPRFLWNMTFSTLRPPTVVRELALRSSLRIDATLLLLPPSHQPSNVEGATPPADRSTRSRLAACAATQVRKGLGRGHCGGYSSLRQ